MFEMSAATSPQRAPVLPQIPTPYEPNSSPTSRERNPVPIQITDPGTRLQGLPLSPVYVNSVSVNQIPQASSAQIETSYSDRSGTPSSDHRNSAQKENTQVNGSGPSPFRIPRKPRLVSDPLSNGHQVNASKQSPDRDASQIGAADTGIPHQRAASGQSIESARSNGSNGSNGSDGYTEDRPTELSPPLQYHHRHFSDSNGTRMVANRASAATLRSQTSLSPPSSMTGDNADLVPPSRNHLLGAGLPRPSSAYSTFSDGRRGRTTSPGFSPQHHMRASSAYGGRSPEIRPLSYVDLLNVPYPQQAPAATNLDNAHLRTAVGSNASLLSTKQTLEMYRANVKKTNDPAVQYEFAIFMIGAAKEAGVTSSEAVLSPLSDSASEGAGTSSIGAEFLREARHILQRLSDRSYPFAQYYLADGYASGLFNKGKPDNDRAFPLFIAASKHGHAEAGYRAALCYEFGWGTRKDPQKAVQFYRQSASKNHPGAMSRLGRACLSGDMGLTGRYREGVKWLKRAAESADYQYNSAPYELGVLHENGFGDDIFQDESYAAQLFTQSADLGHAEASYRLGDAYEHGKLSCPKDPGLSVHFYTGAAQQGHPLAMMALCAWYMIGAEPILEKDENEAYEWARKAAETGLPKAEYAVGYFTEMGIGCRRDPLEANVWYVRAADQGDERAKHRIAAIRAAASGGSVEPVKPTTNRKVAKGKGGHVAAHHEEEKKGKKWGLF